MESLTSDGGVKKQILREGEGEVCGPTARVTLRYRLSLADADGPFDTSDARKSGSLAFRLGKGKVIRGLEILAASMLEGEKAFGVISSDYAFGKGGLPRCKVPPGASINVDIEMVKIEFTEKKKSIVEMTARERYLEASDCKERGNSFFKEAKIEKAVAQYQRCLRLIEYVFYRPDAGDEDQSRKNGKEDRKDASHKNKPNSLGAENSFAKGNVALNDSSVTNSLEKVACEARMEQNGAKDESREDSQSVVDLGVMPKTAESKLPSHSENGDGKSSDGRSSDSAEEGFVEAEVQPTSEDDLQNQAVAGVEAKSTDSAIDDDVKSADTAMSDDDPAESEVRDIHIAALNNLSLCLIKLGDNKKAENLSSLSSTMDPENYKPLYYR